MDYIFLWCANTIVLNAYLYEDQPTFTEDNIKIIDSIIKNNTYSYTVAVGPSHFKYKFLFFSNTFIHGLLEITNLYTGEVKTYSVNRHSSIIRIYSTYDNYDEFHLYNKSVIINICVQNNKKQSVSSFNINKKSENEFSVIGNKITTNVITTPCESLLVTLFAVAGTCDYDTATCPDTIVFSSSRMLMAIYADINAQLICTNIFPKTKTVGSISVINSDFNQRYEYIKTGDLYQIKEFVNNHTNAEIIKREYDIVATDTSIHVPQYNRTYKITINDNTVRFIKQ